MLELTRRKLIQYFMSQERGMLFLLERLLKPNFKFSLLVFKAETGGSRWCVLLVVAINRLCVERHYDLFVLDRVAADGAHKMSWVNPSH